VKLVTTAADGRSLLLRLVQPGEVLGLPEAVHGNTPFETTAIAAEPSLIAVIPRDKFIRFINSYPQAGVALTVALSQQYKLAQLETKFLAFGETSTVRLARLLLEWAAEHGEPADGGIRIPLLMTHLELAQAIGTTRETVTRIVGNLTRAGVIERRVDGILVHRLHELVHLALPHADTGEAPANGTE
jgi:CRP/FNR family transcriptional regulator